MDQHNWVPLAALLVSALALLWQGYMFWRNTKLNFFQQRYAISAALQHLSKSYHSGTLNNEAVVTCRYATEHANFLFGSDVVAHIHSVLVGASVLCRLSEEQERDRVRQSQVVDSHPAYDRLRAEIDARQGEIRERSVLFRTMIENKTNQVFAPYFSGFDGTPWYIDLQRNLDRWVAAGDEYLNQSQAGPDL